MAARLPLLDERHETAVRLFNGYLEGAPGLVISLYGQTAVLHQSQPDEAVKTAVIDQLRQQLPWLQAIIHKPRWGTDTEKQGTVVWGTAVDQWVREGEARYSIDLLLNQDDSFYLDTRLLRSWLSEQMSGKTVLNTFAYTGSLGVAAMAGGAAQVVHTDLNKRFLNVAKTSYTLNGFPINKSEFITGDFWRVVGRLKRAETLYDCVILDPPFFSTTDGGTVDLNQGSARLINKIRPLVHHGGQIISINNALFVSGADYLAELEAVCADGYVKINQFVDVPADCTGYPHTRQTPPVTDPAPFNHSTKIAILDVHHHLYG